MSTTILIQAVITPSWIRIRKTRSRDDLSSCSQRLAVRHR